MPMYTYDCSKNPTHLKEHYESTSEHREKEAAGFTCERCGAPATLQPQVASSAFVTKGGNLFNFSGAHGRVGRHRNKRVPVVGKGHGVGGRRAPPSIARQPAPTKLVKP